MQQGHMFRPLFVAGSDQGQLEHHGAGAAAGAGGGGGGGASLVEVSRFPTSLAVPAGGGGGVSGFPPQGVLPPEVTVFGQFDHILPQMALLHPLQLSQQQQSQAAAAAAVAAQRQLAHQHQAAQAQQAQAAQQQAAQAQAQQAQQQQQAAARSLDEQRQGGVRGTGGVRGGGVAVPTAGQGAGQTAAPSDGRPTDYASRHQAAEQRRRTRINERLERLRKVVPHAERANTATFLEQVLTYIEELNRRVSTLEEQVAAKDAELKDLHASTPAAGAPALHVVDRNGVANRPELLLGHRETGLRDDEDCVVVGDQEEGVKDSRPGTPPTTAAMEDGWQGGTSARDRYMKRGANPVECGEDRDSTKKSRGAS